MSAAGRYAALMGSPADPIYSASGSVHRKTPSGIYVLPEWVGERPTIDSRSNVPYLLLLKHRAEIEANIPLLAEELRFYEGEVLRSQRSLREWFHAFRTAYMSGVSTVPTRRRRAGAFVRAPRSPRADWSDIMWSVGTLVDVRAHGVTQGELKDAMDSDSNGVTGALSDMHAAGLIACLEAKR